MIRLCNVGGTARFVATETQQPLKDAASKALFRAMQPEDEFKDSGYQTTANVCNVWSHLESGNEECAAQSALEKIISEVETIKNEGNDAFKECRFAESSTSYRRGLRVLEGAMTHLGPEPRLVALCITLCTNSAMSDFRAAEDSEDRVLRDRLLKRCVRRCECALKFGPRERCAKARYCGSKALIMLGEVDQAVEWLTPTSDFLDAAPNAEELRSICIRKSRVETERLRLRLKGLF